MKNTKRYAAPCGMRDALKFVQGAVSHQDYLPALTHLCIKTGFVNAYNGIIHLRAPAPIDLTVAPKGVQFIKAINACANTIQLYVTEAKKLAVLSGNLHALIDCIEPDTFPLPESTGLYTRLPAPILPALRLLRPFVATDQSRPWACGILFGPNGVFATNNIVLVQYWLGGGFTHPVNLPAQAVDELLRINEEPESVQINERNVTFNFSGQRRLMTQLLESNWPDVMSLLDARGHANVANVVPGLFDALTVLAPFCNEQGDCFFRGNNVATTNDPQNNGTSVAVDDVPGEGCFSMHNLLNLRGVADSIDFTTHANLATFAGKFSRGIIVGKRF